MYINVTCISKTENKRNFRKASAKKSQKLSHNGIKCIVWYSIEINRDCDIEISVSRSPLEKSIDQSITSIYARFHYVTRGIIILEWWEREKKEKTNIGSEKVV